MLTAADSRLGDCAAQQWGGLFGLAAELSARLPRSSKLIMLAFLTLRIRPERTAVASTCRTASAPAALYLCSERAPTMSRACMIRTYLAWEWPPRLGVALSEAWHSGPEEIGTGSSGAWQSARGSWVVRRALL